MATIGKIRKRSGLLLIFVGLALVAFILGDFVRKNNRHSQEPLAVVSSEKISNRDFNAKVDEQKELFKIQNGDAAMTTAQTFELYNSVFDQMVNNVLVQKEYDALGLAVGERELLDLFSGKFVHPFILKLFTNPETGQFNPAAVTQYVEKLEELPAEQQQQWHAIENAILNDRIMSKYSALVSKAYYLPKAFAKRDFEAKNKKYVVRYFGLRYNTISDSAITVDEKQMREYYDKHKHEYESDAFVDFEYVVFDIKPSATDVNAAMLKISEAYEALKSAKDEEVASVVLTRSDQEYTWDSSYVRREALPANADTLIKMPLGTTIAPYANQYTFFIHRLIDKKSVADSINADHILVAYKGATRADEKVIRTKDQAKKLADSLLNVVKKGDSITFAKLAAQFSNDPSAAQNGGKLGWFAEGTMVPGFNKACLNTAPKNYTIAETDFGFHVIRVNQKTKPVEKYKVATIQYTIMPSKQTADSIYNLASTFASVAKDSASFNKMIIDKGYNKRIAEKVKVSDYTFPGVQEGREIIRWAYKEKVTKGTVSTVFDLMGEDKNVIAILKNRHEKGIASFEEVKAFIQPFVKKEIKSQKLLEKVKGAMNGSSNIEAIAQKLNVEVDTTDLTFATYSVPAYGPEAAFVGTVSSLAKGKMSKPIIGESAIFVAIVDDISVPEVNLAPVYAQQNSFFASRVSYELMQILARIAKIEDNRVLYF